MTYQLPAVISEGLTLVVTPLISLMEDQIFALQVMNKIFYPASFKHRENIQYNGSRPSSSKYIDIDRYINRKSVIKTLGLQIQTVILGKYSLSHLVWFECSPFIVKQLIF